LLLDDVRQPTLEIIEKLKECPQCGKAMDPYEVPKKKRRSQMLECSTCHLRIEVKTRNNKRLVSALFAVTYAFVIGWLVSILLGAFV